MVAKKTTTKTTASKKKETVVAETPTPIVEQTTTAATAATATIAATATTTVEEEIPDVFSKFSSFLAKLQGVSSQFSSLRTEFRALERDVSRQLKAAHKASAKRKRKSGNRAPSGFVKPTLISNELAAFLGKPQGTEMARTDVTREINAYIREHSLQNKDNGRIILPDTKLKGLLKIKKGEELTYFNLQRYMSPHFAKAGAAIVEAVATV
jgi:chromatin remodeling complex protein RSC6